MEDPMPGEPTPGDRMQGARVQGPGAHGLFAEGIQFRWSRRGRPALDGVSLEVPQGRLTAVVGPNGSGKSTLLKVLAGIRAPQLGRVSWRDASGLSDLGRISPRDRARRIAVVPQTLPPMPGVTVARCVAHGLYAQSGQAAPPLAVQVRAALAQTEAEHLIHRWMEELSGGERQRVLLARALAQDTPMLLCDEPTAALDLEHQAQVFGLLRDLAHQPGGSRQPGGHGVLAITHDLNLAGQCADWMVVLDRGRKVAEGPPRSVLQPAVLGPVFGDRLRYGELDGAAGGARWVLPRP